jgi:hypothetical protein
MSTHEVDDDESHYWNPLCLCGHFRNDDHPPQKGCLRCGCVRFNLKEGEVLPDPQSRETTSRSRGTLSPMVKCEGCGLRVEQADVVDWDEGDNTTPSIASRADAVPLIARPTSARLTVEASTLVSMR